MNIKQRIVMLVTLVFAALAVIGGFAVIQARSNSEQVKQVTEGVVPSAIASVELMTQLKDVQIAVLAMISAADENLVRIALEELNAKRETLTQALKDQHAQADSQAQRGLIEAAQESMQNYFASINDTAQFKLAGQTELAEANMGATVDQYLREQGQMIDAVQVEKRRSKDEAIDTLNAELSNTTVALMAISGAATLVLGLIGVLLYKQVIHPIAQMEAKMTQIATSQDFTHRLDVASDDEIGRSMKAFNTMVEKIEESSALVRQKAADIQAMLRYVPQGILTVQPDGSVHHEYSEYLESILETREIAGRNVMDLVLKDTPLGEDARSQVLAALSSCLGEDAMNFEFNSHLFPTEIQRQFADGRSKILDLSWAPITAEDGTVMRLLLCVRDVTELRKLALEASAQGRELAIIGEILAMEPAKFERFLDSSQAYLAENVQAVRGTDAADARATAPAVDLLFRNMHTIKGNARTYGLQQLTDVVHRVEQDYDALRTGDKAWDAEALLSDLQTVRAALDEYAAIHTHKLGRGASEASLEAGPLLRLDRAELDAVLARLQVKDGDSRDVLAAAVQHTRSALERLDTQRLGVMLKDVLGALPALAVELEKEEPRITLADEGVGIRSAAAAALQDTFMHLLRNALDHGLETPLARIAKGKPAAGQIRIDVVSDARGLHITTSDDGRGLDLNAIRAKALEKQLVDADAVVSQAEIAQYIFLPGFSTAQQVTDISGRGVGMDAVRSLVQSQGGRIDIQLLGREGDPVRGFQTVLTLPAALAISYTEETVVVA
ncbi:ATP-binding protein [Acidovorax sp. CCYZU-2555]|uniref:ATP-binding protein n=1 Tax=Acidovorax sp. CCYZU-2555 TaxID=2835042 RepID=UPI001BCC6FBC|nr:ATP-binding protein [Acidovorax sp. CCYZU-2555]MBS7779269.1 Hpt domain-containing protein [Acidovorax sp. CCYZU-2555]